MNFTEEMEADLVRTIAQLLEAAEQDHTSHSYHKPLTDAGFTYKDSRHDEPLRGKRKVAETRSTHHAYTHPEFGSLNVAHAYGDPSKLTGVSYFPKEGSAKDLGLHWRGDRVPKAAAMLNYLKKRPKD